MPDGSLFPRNPLAGRDAAFRDANGNNPFRDESANVVEAEEVGPNGEIVPPNSPSAFAAPSAYEAQSAYAAAGAPGVRRYESGDFDQSLVSQSSSLVLHATICLVALAMAWFGLILVILILGVWGWALFFPVWFGLTGFVGIRGIVLARGELQAVRLGALSAVARPNIVVALVLSWLVTALSLAGIAVSIAPIVRDWVAL